MEANTTQGGVAVRVPAGTYRLSSVGASDDDPRHGDLDVRSNVELVGAAEKDTRIEGPGSDRLFHVLSGSLRLTGMTLAGGSTLTLPREKRPGGAVRVEAGALFETSRVSVLGAKGGGVFNAGTTRLEDTTIADCSEGPGIFNQGGGASLLVRRSDIRSNVNRAGGQGGGIETQAFGASTRATVTIEQSTIRDNKGFGGGGVSANSNSTVTILDSTIAGNEGAAGIYNDGASSFDIRGSTITANRGVTGPGGGIAEAHRVPSFIVLQNSIVAGNVGHPTSPQDCMLAMTLKGGNFIGSASGSSGQVCNLVKEASDRVGVDPLLGPRVELARGAYYLPKLGSPALDNGVPGCSLADQNGTSRSRDGNGDRLGRCDSGAAER